MFTADIEISFDKLYTTLPRGQLFFFGFRRLYVSAPANDLYEGGRSCVFPQLLIPSNATTSPPVDVNARSMPEVNSYELHVRADEVWLERLLSAMEEEKKKKKRSARSFRGWRFAGRRSKRSARKDDKMTSEGT